ncbi:MAG TPA: hypothetical protein VLT79_11130 [Gemmatimonadales bacterium]|nr:hypothetical protein [Gemmatimonadales bacterium]
MSSSAQQPAAAMAEMAATDSSEAMAGEMAHDAHMRMTAMRHPTGGDSARVRDLLEEMHRALGKYQDVRVAEADGFRRFLPNLKQPLYHYTNWRWALEAAFTFNPDTPTSLLYRERADGGLELVGAMYTAPARASEDELNARIPTSILPWHQHVNWCLPPRDEPARWRDVRDGVPLFGPRSPIATRDACEAVGGRFRSRIFGWMVHVALNGGHER